VKEACGVVGIVAPGRSVSHLCYDALYALQHRGQESAGMATFNNHQITVVKDNGLVSHVFAETTLRALAGDFVIGHTRYSTSGSANWTAAQPVYRSAGTSGFAIAHNGNLTNTTALAEEACIQFTSMLSDSDLVAELLAREVESGISLAKALGVVLARTEGAYSMVVLEAGEIHAVRDPYGFRPLCLGRFGSEEQPDGWIVASESPALDVVGATFVREILPGEMVTISNKEVSSVQLLDPAEGKQKLCIFEFVYFARPDTYLMGHQVHTTRRRMDSPRPRAFPSATASSRIATSVERSSRPTRVFGPRPFAASSTLFARTSKANDLSSLTTRSCAVRRRARSSRCSVTLGPRKCTCVSRPRPS